MVMGVEYLAAAVVFLMQHNAAYALVMACYGVANIGLLLAAK
jgi:hypothetical protein